jgi:hypothetical protein
MRTEDLFESINPQLDIMTQRAISSQRTPRLRLKTLLRLRRIRERRKLEKLKDMELYYIMYGSDNSNSGGM